MYYLRPLRRRWRRHPALFDFDFNWPEPLFHSWQSFDVDIKETADSYEIHAELPGVPKENINLSLDNGYLTIAVKQESLREEDGQNYLRRERRQMASQRSFYVGSVDPDKVTAKHHNGVLEITLPKPSPDEPHRRRIEIQ